jgi:hypothetical protein
MRRKYAAIVALASLIFVTAAHLDYLRVGGHKGGMDLLWSFLASFPLSIGTEWAWDAGLHSLLPADPAEPAKVNAHLWVLTVTGIIQAVAVWLIIRGRSQDANPVNGERDEAESMENAGGMNSSLARVTLWYMGAVVMVTLMSIIIERAGPTQPWIGGDHGGLWSLSFYATFPTSIVDPRLLVLETFIAGLIQATVVWVTLRRRHQG